MVCVIDFLVRAHEPTYKCPVFDFALFFTKEPKGAFKRASLRPAFKTNSKWGVPATRRASEADTYTTSRLRVHHVQQPCGTRCHRGNRHNARATSGSMGPGIQFFCCRSELLLRFVYVFAPKPRRIPYKLDAATR